MLFLVHFFVIFLPFFLKVLTQQAEARDPKPAWGGGEGGKPLEEHSLACSVPKPLKVPSLARSVPKPLRVRSVLKPLKVPSLARSVQKALKVPSLARSVLKPLKVPKSDLDLDDDHKI